MDILDNLNAEQNHYIAEVSESANVKFETDSLVTGYITGCKIREAMLSVDTEDR